MRVSKRLKFTTDFFKLSKEERKIFGKKYRYGKIVHGKLCIYTPKQLLKYLEKEDET